MRIILQTTLLLLATWVAVGQESRYVQAEDGEIHYRVIGEGETILVINGGPGFSSEGFVGIAQQIASLGYRTILFDQRGTGESTLRRTDSTTVTMELMAQDMELIRKDIRVNSWILFGHSFGGMLANYYTSRFPERVSAIIHSSSGGLDLHVIGNAQENLYARLTPLEIDSLTFWRSRMMQGGSESDRRNFNRYMASAYVYDKAHVPVVSQRLMQGNMGLNRMVWEDMIRIDFDCKEALQSFDKPVLILQGEQDIIPRALAFTADSVFTDARLFFLDRCGHYGWLDRKEEYLRRIRHFLRDLDKT